MSLTPFKHDEKVLVRVKPLWGSFSLAFRSWWDFFFFTVDMIWSNEIFAGCRLKALAVRPPPSVMKVPQQAREFRLNFNSGNLHRCWIYSPPVKSWIKLKSRASERRILQSEIVGCSCFVLCFLFGASYIEPESRKVQKWAMNWAIMLNSNTTQRLNEHHALLSVKPEASPVKLCLHDPSVWSKTTIQPVFHNSKKLSLRGDVCYSTLHLWEHRVHISGLETGDSRALLGRDTGVFAH